MARMLRLLVGMAAAGILSVLPLQASAAAAFRATIAPGCVSPGGQVKVTIPNLAAGTAVGVRGEFAIASGSGNVVYGSGNADSGGLATVTVTVPTNAAAGSFTVFILVAGNNSDAYVGATVRLETGATACPSPGELLADGAALQNAVSNSLKKTCDTGVSGNAVFALTINIGEGGTYHMGSATAACNGAAVVLPALPGNVGAGVSLVLHETGVPTNGVAAADTTAEFDAGTVTVHNAKAAVTATPTPTPAPTPTPRRLPATGGATEGRAASTVLGALLIGMLLMGVGGSVAFLSRRRPTI